MKRIPPSVQMKEDVEQVRWGDAVEGASLGTPMQSFVRSLARYILAKLPRLMQGQMKRLVQQVFLGPSYAVALKRGRALIARFCDRYPAAMECLERDLEKWSN